VRPFTRRRFLAALGGSVLGGSVLGACATAPTAGRGPARLMKGKVPALPTTTTTTTTDVGFRFTPVAPRSAPIYYVDEYNPGLPKDAVALTIDDGPDEPWTPEVLDLLSRYQVKATFSLIGRQVAKHGDLVQAIVAEGHSVCNHSMTHPEPFAILDEPEIERQIVGCMEAIYDVLGTVPGVFRSPGGDWSPAVYDCIARYGMVPIDWSVDPKDFARPGTAYITRKLVAARPGQILLCHDGGGNRSETVASLKVVLPALKARGLQFVTL